MSEGIEPRYLKREDIICLIKYPACEIPILVFRGEVF